MYVVSSFPLHTRFFLLKQESPPAWTQRHTASARCAALSPFGGGGGRGYPLPDQEGGRGYPLPDLDGEAGGTPFQTWRGGGGTPSSPNGGGGLPFPVPRGGGTQMPLVSKMGQMGIPIRKMGYPLQEGWWYPSVGKDGVPPPPSSGRMGYPPPPPPAMVDKVKALLSVILRMRAVIRYWYQSGEVQVQERTNIFSSHKKNSKNVP